MKIAFIDFLDSFSYNVIQELTQCDHEVTVFTYPNHEGAWDYDFLVLGPGPGHPKEYSDVISLLKKRIDSNKKTLGVCLGHQLIWSALGFEVIRSEFPLHGQKIEINLNQYWQKFLALPEKVKVQRYNSLVVNVHDFELPRGVVACFSQEEIQISRSSNWLSYQFHPESVGTSFQKAFFSVIPQV